MGGDLHARIEQDLPDGDQLIVNLRLHQCGSDRIALDCLGSVVDRTLAVNR